MNTVCVASVFTSVLHSVPTLWVDNAIWNAIIHCQSLVVLSISVCHVTLMVWLILLGIKVT